MSNILNIISLGRAVICLIFGAVFFSRTIGIIYTISESSIVIIVGICKFTFELITQENTIYNEEQIYKFKIWSLHVLKILMNTISLMTFDYPEAEGYQASNSVLYIIMAMYIIDSIISVLLVCKIINSNSHRQYRIDRIDMNKVKIEMNDIKYKIEIRIKNGERNNEDNNDNGEKDEKCSVCLDLMNGKDECVKTDCDHRFHYSCIISHIIKCNELCPICRSSLLLPTSF